MRYDRTTQSLYSDSSELIRKFRCPLAKAWDHLSSTSNNYVRYCGSCSKNVMDITPFDERQMIALFKVHPEQCAHLNFEESEEKIVIEGEASASVPPCAKLNNDMPVIQTARGIDAINDAITSGYRVDIRETDVMNAICWNGRWGKRKDGLIEHSHGYTFEPSGYTSHPQGYLDSPLSAYIIPADLNGGTQVYVTDVIEHIVKSTHHSKSRLTSGTGIWDGKSLIVDKPEVQHMIG
jgi:hypothetical protein